MHYPQSLYPTLAALYHLGKRVCLEVENFHPDIVIGLAHSGWMPVMVARALWSKTRTGTFPSAVRTNIGQEKHALYKQRFKASMPAYCCGICCDGSSDRIGHYLAWIADQQSWLDALHTQIQAVRSGEPARILVVDDLFGGYRTCYLILGLLDILYPHSYTYMVAGGRDLTNDFVDAWLQQFVPTLASEIAQNTAKNTHERYANPWHELLKPLITGSEDGSPESLDWQPLRPESLAVQKLAGMVSSETVLAAPSWAVSLACQFALNCLRSKSFPYEPFDEDDSNTSLRFPEKIDPAVRLFRHAWLNSGINRKEIARMYASAPGGLAEGLRQVKRFSHPHGRGRGVVHMPNEATDSWITAYDPPRPSGGDSERLIISGFGEFIPGHLWAGAYPHFKYSPQPAVSLSQVEMCKDLLSRGVRCFLDLTTSSDYPARFPYQAALDQAGRELGLESEHIHFPLGFRNAPTRSRMSALLQQIGTILDAGQGLYIHAGHNLEGRVPMLLACLLIDQGFSPQQALSRVTDFWLPILPYLIRLPISDRQRQFVLRWKQG